MTEEKPEADALEQGLPAEPTAQGDAVGAEDEGHPAVGPDEDFEE